MKEALYREYLLISENKKISSLIKYILIVLFIATLLIVITKNQSLIAFVIAMTIGQLTTVFARDDKNGTLAILKTMPIKPYKYVLARYISVFVLFIGVVLILLISENLAGVISNIDASAEDEFYKALIIFIVIVLINIYIPGYYKFGANSFKLIVLIALGTAFSVFIIYLIAFNANMINNSYNILIAIVSAVIITAISILLSVKSFKNRDL